MPTIWNGENDHKLFLWILHHIETKDIDVEGFANFLGNGCTPKAIGVHISTLRSKSKDIQTSAARRSGNAHARAVGKTNADSFTPVNGGGAGGGGMVKGGKMAGTVKGRPKKGAVSGSGEGLGMDVGEEGKVGGGGGGGGGGGKRKRGGTEQEGGGNGVGGGGVGVEEEEKREVKKVQVEGADDGAEGAEEGK
ncbi:hypothetical protein N7G274_005576 [Stereocaulon virgatum]|uniref:Uncharacterized protein n=1 Tax=Stereocaulon virgatum TaxID=373712 RepID=A0ABR4ABC6_9LECA